MAKKKTKRHFERLKIVGVIGVIFCGTLFFLAQPKQEQHANTDQISEQEKLTFFSNIKVQSQKNQHEHGVFASITMAQAALESDFGKSQLAERYHNLFGVKGSAANGVLLPTAEYVEGKWVTIEAYFKVYPDWETSILEHGDLIQNGTTWNKEQYKAVKQAKTYQEAANGLVKSGYATDPNYAEKLIALIEKYKLYQYDD